MTSLQRVIQQVPHLQDNLDVQSLNSLAMTCRELNQCTLASDAYRKHFNQRQDRLPGTVGAKAPNANYKQLCHGDRATLKRALRPAEMTQQDLDAIHALRVYTNSQWWLDKQPQRLQDLAKPWRDKPYKRPMSGREKAACWCLLSTLAVGGMVTAWLFFARAPMAGVAALIVLGLIITAEQRYLQHNLLQCLKQLLA